MLIIVALILGIITMCISIYSTTKLTHLALLIYLYTAIYACLILLILEYYDVY